MTALITLSFMMRNTSPVGWIPLLVMKMYEGQLKSMIVSGVVVAVPIMGVCVALDSVYFGQLTITSYNFLRANVMEGLSKYYGVEPFHQYLLVYFPLFFTALFPLVLLGLWSYFSHMR